MPGVGSQMEVGSAIASTLKWDADVMDWIAHPADGANSGDPDTLNIIIVLADKKIVGYCKYINSVC